MKALRSVALILALIATACTGTSRKQAEGGAEMLDQVMAWWPGDYHNDRQLDQLRAAGKPIWKADGSGKPGHIAVTSHYRRVNLPEFGDQVLYVEETKHGDPSAIFRQRIYTLTRDVDSDVVTVKLWYFKDKTRYLGAWRDAGILAELTPDQMSPLPENCDLTIRRQEARYHMSMPPKQCVFGERYFDYQVLLGPDSFWFRDRIVNAATDEVMEAAGNFTYHELDQVAP
ncbi:MAG: chromophore lyase CpcT/CpeT [Pseudomonadota bacterium]